MGCTIWETCLLLPVNLTRSECASWVQAVGSVAAIVAALLLWRLDRIREQRQAIAVAKAFCRGLFGALEHLKEACRAKDRNGAHSFVEVLDDVRIMGQSVPLDRLPTKYVAVIVPLRALLTHASSIVGSHIADNGQIAWDPLLAFLDHTTKQAIGIAHKEGLVEFTSPKAQQLKKELEESKPI